MAEQRGVTPEHAGDRLDAFVSSAIPDLSRSWSRQLIDSGNVLVNGSRAKAARRVQVGDVVTIDVIPPPGMSAAPEEIPLDIVYQDEDVAVINKRAGLVVHPSAGHHSGTLANGLAAAFPRIAEVGPAQRPGIVHRLDKDTSGLMVVALNPTAHSALQKQIAERSAERRYLALVPGLVEPAEGMIEGPIGRDEKRRDRMAVGGIAARPARTSYRIVESLPDFTLLEARLHTGRTHQIRVHLAGVGHPIAGDRLYGGAAVEGLARQFLHAYKLSFRSPTSGKRLEFSSELPEDLLRVREMLRSPI
ncbi:MAG: RluA family pseudouridine synthase [Chloroflexota bacterium]